MTSPLVQEALQFARQRHHGQIRKGDGRPFVTHPIAVARWLAKAAQPEEVIAAGVLHDVLEDTPTTVRELEQRFGKRVARLVQEVTEPDKRWSWEDRKADYCAHLQRASRGALIISCSDKLHNLSALLKAYSIEGAKVFQRFSRGIEKKTAQDRLVYETILEAWPECPLLSRFEQQLKTMEKIVHQRMSRSPPKEVEAKFILKDSRIGKSLLKLKTLGQFHAVGRRREKQRNIYFDTEDLRLKKAHAALKLRVVGHRAELSFKKEKSYRQGISQRIEMTIPILKKQLSALERGHWAQPPFSQWEPIRRARAISGDKPLRKVATLFTDRRRILFVSQKRLFEMDLDEVTLSRAGAKKFLQREVELENITASSKQFQQALRELRHRWRRGLESSRVSKYELALRNRQDFPRGGKAA